MVQEQKANMLSTAPYVSYSVFGCVLYNKMQVTQVELAAVEVAQFSCCLTSNACHNAVIKTIML